MCSRLKSMYSLICDRTVLADSIALSKVSHAINDYKTNNIFCIKHPTHCLITGKSNSGKTNILMNLIAQNCIYDKIHIFTNNSNDDKYIWLKNKFKNDVYIYINEVNFDKIDKN